LTTPAFQRRQVTLSPFKPQSNAYQTHTIIQTPTFIMFCISFPLFHLLRVFLSIPSTPVASKQKKNEAYVEKFHKKLFQKRELHDCEKASSEKVSNKNSHKNGLISFASRLSRRRKVFL
jgi:hypothetical protein